MDKGLWLSASHLPGSANVEADFESRKLNSDMEWMLDPEVFQSIMDIFGYIDIDMFSSRLNYQINPYVAYRPDTYAVAKDAFTLVWSKYRLMYMFPPFCVVGKDIQKLEEDEAEGVLVAPLWPTQPWFSKLLRLVSAQPYLLPKPSQILHLPQNPEKVHPLT